MRLVFMGTAAFAVPSLEVCAEQHEVALVVTQPDRPGSRGRPAPRPVRDAAARLGLRFTAPVRVRDTDAIGEVMSNQPDCIVVAAYGQILPAPLLDGPRLGAVNVHASLLPRWRGATPIEHAILTGDAETGVSIMRMEQGLDTGPVYATAHVAIDDDMTTPALTAVLARLGADTLLPVLAALQRGEAQAHPQPEDGVTLAPRLRRESGELRWEELGAIEVDRHVRALQPWPGVTLPLGGQRVRIVSGAPASAGAAGAAPGTVVGRAGDAVVVAAREGEYRVATVRPAGGRTMGAAAYLRGRRA